MFINPDIIIAAFASLSSIAPSSEGKVARERLSGLKYLLAAAEILKANNQSSVDLSPSSGGLARKKFIEAVGNVVRLDDAGGYSNNFGSEFERAKDFKVGNNFLTTVFKDDGDYPRRPPFPLIHMENENISLASNFRDNLNEYGKFDDYRIPLAVWLVRFYEFSESDGNDIDAFSISCYKVLTDRYGTVLPVTSDEIKLYLQNFTCPLLVEPRTDYFALLNGNRTSSIPSTLNGENIIYYGAPGTGKSYALKIFTPSIRTVFHSEYQNADFVGSYKPFMDNGKVTYSFVPGPFIYALVNAIKAPSEMQYLIIEEINRANAGAVFGEIIQLLDRDSNGQSEYDIYPDISLKNYLDTNLKSYTSWAGRLYIPSNLSIFATMNSADQGVEPLDSAFKRRWKFNYLPISFDLIISTDVRRKPLIPFNDKLISWCDFAEACNEIMLSSSIEEDRLLGPYFLSNSDFTKEDELEKIIIGKVFIYLWDDVLRHGLRDILFKTERCRSFYELVNRYRNNEHVFSSRLEQCLQSEISVTAPSE